MESFTIISKSAQLSHYATLLGVTCFIAQSTIYSYTT